MLDAAEVVVVRQGIANLTLDAVAAEAGLSKGGLLHHFPSKDRLIEAMVVRAAENQRDYYSDAFDARRKGPAAWRAACSTTASPTPRAGRISSGAAPPPCSPRSRTSPR